MPISRDTFFGEEPALGPPEGPAPKTPETPPGDTPETPPTEPPTEPPQEPEGEEPPPQEALGEEDEGLDTLEQQPDEPPPPPREGRQQRPWSQLRRLQREKAELEKQLAAREAAEEALRIQSLREQEARRLAQEQEQTAAGRPGIDRPYTNEELTQLYNEDPIEYARVRAEMAEQRAIRAEQSAETRRQQDFIQGQVADFKRTHPDYDSAVDHLYEREAARFRAIGVPEAQAVGNHAPAADGGCCIEHAVMLRASYVINTAVRSGKNIAQALYEVARADGWTPTEAPSAPATPTPQTPAVAPASPLEKVRDSRRRSEIAAVSAAGGDGGPATIPIKSHEDLLNMSQKDYDEMDAKYGPGWEKHVTP